MSDDIVSRKKEKTEKENQKKRKKSFATCAFYLSMASYSSLEKQKETNKAPLPLSFVSPHINRTSQLNQLHSSFGLPSVSRNTTQLSNRSQNVPIRSLLRPPFRGRDSLPDCQVSYSNRHQNC